MAFWFLRGLRRGVVTTRYPRTADASAVDLPTPPAFVPALLDESDVERLVEGCPSGALWRDANDLVVDLGRCTACGRCAAIAPDAVRPSGAFELAATKPEQLIKRIPIGRGER